MNAYWIGQAASDIGRLFLDPARIPARLVSPDTVETLGALPYRDRTSDLLIWELNGEAAGMSSLRNIRYGVSGEIHLHMIEARFRRRGYGHRFFVLSLQEFFRRFELNKIVCEPS
jgi:hypothetical protein